jgi:hypothetical protein
LRRISLLLALGVLAALAPAAAQQTLTLCGCDPAPCPAGYTQYEQGFSAICPGCPSGGTANYRKCTRCGDGVCDRRAESGGTCGQDCCDAGTSCTQTYLNQGTTYCRRFSTDYGSSWNPWGWWTISDYNTAWCNTTAQQCGVEANCQSTRSICSTITGATGRWKILPTTCNGVSYP